MSKILRAVRMAMNVRRLGCQAGWRWVYYIEF